MIKKNNKNNIIILDYGSQYTQLIGRRIRELGVYCEIFSWNSIKEKILKFNPKGIILSGSPESVTKSNYPCIPDYIFKLGIPILGICYGMQIMVIQLGGKVKKTSKREFGYAKVKVLKTSKLINNIKDRIDSNGISILDVWMSHNDEVTKIPLGFDIIANTKTCSSAIIANEEKQFYGIQFHPEVTHTNKGKEILKRFVYNICLCVPLWKINTIIKKIIKKNKQLIKKNYVILGLSGGIDSAVTAILLHKSIGKQLICIFIDNGLLQTEEDNNVINKLKKCYNLNIIKISAEEKFFSALNDVIDPEQKRKIIGKTFIEIFNKQALKLNKVKWLAQGTIYPDIIESASNSDIKSDIIKSHHNVGGLPKDMKLNLIEPIKYLFKDEVRNIGKSLNIPHNIIYRHPFPGPGLSIRILGKVKRKYCNILRLADMIFIEELKNANLYDKISQAFTVFLPIKSVAIMGDVRKYDWVISLRAINSIDFMTAKCAHIPYKVLEIISSRIINEIKGISRVVYDISSKPPSTIEWE